MFRVNDVSRQIAYYTVILDRDQYQERRQDGPILVKRRVPPRNLQRNFERIVFDRAQDKYVSVATYKDDVSTYKDVSSCDVGAT